MKGFKKFGGAEIEDLGLYIQEYLALHDDVKVLVGCDSEQYKKYTKYAVTVCLYHAGKGAHVIFKTENAKCAEGRHVKIRNIAERLWSEIEKVKVVAEYLETALDGHVRRMPETELAELGYEAIQNKLVEVHVDFNPNPHTPIQISRRGRKRRSLRRMTVNKSNQLHPTAVGYLVGNGFRVKTKPFAWAASCAADLICRK
jgi:predicted RNase H-related nuclease YkuK (DUF458 family)